MLLNRTEKIGTASNAYVNILEVIRLINNAWEAVESTCITKCFLKAGLEKFQDKIISEEEVEKKGGKWIQKNLKIKQEFESIDANFIIPKDIVAEDQAKDSGFENSKNFKVPSWESTWKV